MGSISSKTSSESMQGTQMSKVKNNKNKSNLENILLDPRSPDINRTPLASILASRMRTAEETPSTPTKYVRETILNNPKENKFLDPRSPSQFIPRTPLNLSLKDDNIEINSGQYSLEYSGCIEEASCRNFNERLANITFDDNDELCDRDNASKRNEKKTIEAVELIDISNLCTVDEEEDLDLSDSLKSAENGIQITPIPTLEAPKRRFETNVLHVDNENISPLVDLNMCIKRNALSAFSSTPNSTTICQQKQTAKKHNKLNTEIFKDDQKTNNNMEYTTPAKRMAKIKEVDNPRTPFGSIQNHRSKSTENLSHQPQTQIKEIARPYHINNENFTPNSKFAALSKQGNNSRRINQIAYD